MFKIMDHFDRSLDEEWEFPLEDSESDLGNKMKRHEVKRFKAMIEFGNTESCDKGKTYIIEAPKITIAVIKAWNTKRDFIQDIMRTLAVEIRDYGDPLLTKRQVDQKEQMSDFVFLVPFMLSSKEFKDFIDNGQQESSYDEFGIFIQTCWIDTLKPNATFKKLRDAMLEYFY